MALTIPVGFLQVWAPTPGMAFFWAAPFLIGLGIYLGPTWALVQTLAPPSMRAFAVAFMFFILNIIALGLAPLWVGALSDFFARTHGETDGLRWALTTLGASSLISVAAYFWTSKKLPADWEKATAKP
jgi:MFS family permease